MKMRKIQAFFYIIGYLLEHYTNMWQFSEFIAIKKTQNPLSRDFSLKITKNKFDHSLRCYF
jgi:hypothetical protein